jgi:hypothetical protein
LEILCDAKAAARISESLAALEHGEPGADMATVRQDFAGAASPAPWCIKVVATLVGAETPEQTPHRCAGGAL